MLWIALMLAVCLAGVGSGILMAFSGFTGKIVLPDKDRWYSGIYSPGKGSEWLVGVIGVIWSVTWLVLGAAFIRHSLHAL